jgi:hypothetical protein
MAEELLPAGAPRGTAVTPDALAAVAVSLVKGVRGAGDDRSGPVRHRA